MNNICPVCLNNLYYHNRIYLSCCDVDICKACDKLNTFTHKCDEKKNHAVTIHYWNGCQDDNQDEKFSITKIENNIDDSNDFDQMNIIIEMLFPNNKYNEIFDTLKLPIIENAINKLKNINYGILLIDDSEFKRNDSKTRNKFYNLLSLLIIEWDVRSIHKFSHKDAKKMVKIASILMNKNINLTGGIYSRCLFISRLHSTYEKKPVYYFYKNMVKLMDLKNQREQKEKDKKNEPIEKSESSFKKFFAGLKKRLFFL